jgi:hypothetical protein
MFRQNPDRYLASSPTAPSRLFVVGGSTASGALSRTLSSQTGAVLLDPDRLARSFLSEHAATPETVISFQLGDAASAGASAAASDLPSHVYVEAIARAVASTGRSDWILSGFPARPPNSPSWSTRAWSQALQSSSRTRAAQLQAAAQVRKQKHGQGKSRRPLLIDCFFFLFFFFCLLSCGWPGDRDPAGGGGENVPTIDIALSPEDDTQVARLYSSSCFCFSSFVFVLLFFSFFFSPFCFLLLILLLFPFFFLFFFFCVCFV